MSTFMDGFVIEYKPRRLPLGTNRAPAVSATMRPCDTEWFQRAYIHPDTAQYLGHLQSVAGNLITWDDSPICT